MEQGSGREIPLVPDLNFEIDQAIIHRHVDVETAEFVAECFRRHFRIPYLEQSDALECYAKQLRNEPFQEIGVFHEQYFEQYVVLEGIFKFDSVQFALPHKSVTEVAVSDYYISFIPNSIDYAPTENHIKRLSEFAIADCEATLEVNDTVSFADAGENFESVACPRCNADVTEWWGGAMSEAYTPDDGFVNLDVLMPCCGADSTLNDLNYNLPQGFYRVRILTEPGINAQADVAGICAELETITGAPWRAVYQHI
jgi:hypothetical protein